VHGAGNQGKWRGTNMLMFGLRTSGTSRATEFMTTARYFAIMVNVEQSTQSRCEVSVF
jgi:hypothetical protein